MKLKRISGIKLSALFVKQVQIFFRGRISLQVVNETGARYASSLGVCVGVHHLSAFGVETLHEAEQNPTKGHLEGVKDEIRIFLFMKLIFHDPVFHFHASVKQKSNVKSI